MKSISTLILLLSPMLWYAQVGLINNGDFESWTSSVVGQNLDNWQTSNSEWPGVTTASQSTDAAHMSYSLLLETLDYFGDSAFGYIITGEAEIDSAGNFMGGEQHSTNIDSLKIRIKYDVMPGDSATIALIQHGGGFPMLNLWKLTGAQTSWTTLTYPVTGVSHDTIIFAAASSNAFEDFGIPGSWIQIDQVEIINNGGANVDPTNNSFENWTDISYEDPNGWETYNDWGAYLGMVSTTKSTDSYTGSYAAELMVQNFDGDTINSILTNGNVDIGSGFSGGVPYTSMPTDFEGAYKWNPVHASDSAWAMVLFKNGGSIVAGNIISLGISDATTGSYQPFSIPTNIFSTPDSMLVVAWTQAAPGASFLVDAFQLTGNGVGVKEQAAGEFSIYPNPSRNTIYVKGAGINSSLELYDIKGKLVLSEIGSQIDIAHLNEGLYHLRINQTITRKVVVVK